MYATENPDMHALVDKSSYILKMILLDLSALHFFNMSRA